MPRSTPKTDVDAPTEGDVAAPPVEVIDTPAATGVVDTPSAAPKPDQFGRYRVLDKDTGHRLSVHAAALPHGNYEVLDEAASHESTGEPLPPVHKTAVETNPSGQQAENKEELDA